MSTAFKTSELRGVIPPVLTPLSTPDRLDEAGLERLLEHMIAGGVHGLFMLGTTGEFACFTQQMRRQILQAAARIVRGRVPILVNISDNCAENSQQIAGWAAEIGAAALVLSPAAYYPIAQDELQSYFQHLVNSAPLPVFLYNMPSHTKLSIEPQVVRAAMDWPKVIGMKDSSGSMGYFQKILAMIQQHRPEWALMVGPEAMLAETVLMGGHGAVCGGGNLAPRLFVQTYQAALAGDLALLRRLQARIMKLDMTIYSVSPKPSGFICGIKTALSVLGIISDEVARPHLKLPPAQCKLIEQYVKEQDLASECLVGAAK